MSGYAMPAVAARRPARQVGVIAFGFILLQIAFQLALLVPALAPLRVAWRMGCFLISLALLVLLRGKTLHFPASQAAIWVLAIVSLSMLHPDSNSLLSSLAQCTLYFAVIAPLFWVTRMRIDMTAFRRIIAALWCYYTASATVGLLQVYYPGKFQPPLAPAYATRSSALLEGLKITLANGKEIFRPMGLTDTPGGAAIAGMWAVLFGLGFLATARRWRKLPFAASVAVGMISIFLSQTRVAIVVVVIWAVALALILMYRRMYRYLFGLLVFALIAYFSLGATMQLAGSHSVARLQAFTSSRSKAAQTYSSDRGVFLRVLVDKYLPQYPLGAGMGRWGMMNFYFGNNDDPAHGSIYVEIQWTGWLLDGGVPLILAYTSLLLCAGYSLILIVRGGGTMWFWAALVLAYDIGTLAMCFDYTPFVAQSGMEFWFLNALVLTAAHYSAAPARFAPRWARS